MIAFSEFERLAQAYNVIPLVKVLLSDVMTPVSAYLTLREPGISSFLFESVEPDEKIGRYSFVGTNPVVLITAKHGTVLIKEASQAGSRKENFFDVLAGYVSKYNVAPLHDIAGFTGGFAGYVGYDCAGYLENILLPKAGNDEVPDAILGLFTSVIRFDHHRQLVALVHNVILDSTLSLKAQYEEGVKVINTLELRLKKPPVVTNSFACQQTTALVDNEEKAFCEKVRKTKQYIVDGDIFQAVLSRRMCMRYSGDSFNIYRALRIVNPSPYLFYVDFDEVKLIGSSPEVLVSVQNREVTVLPIAGTRRRGKDEAEDVRLETELLADEKELAEHVMLVDLGRNDVGHVAEPGSVRVPVFKQVERFSHVMHIVSEVKGRLGAGKTSIDALKHCFPAGTVSGAPKVRAMEIISELEGLRRGVYAGAVGYIGLNGSLDTCIAIRTIVAHRDELYIQAGAGIVADSIPENEYQETENKARALLEAIRLAANGLQIRTQEEENHDSRYR